MGIACLLLAAGKLKAKLLANTVATSGGSSCLLLVGFKGNHNGNPIFGKPQRPTHRCTTRMGSFRASHLLAAELLVFDLEDARKEHLPSHFRLPPPFFCAV